MSREFVHKILCLFWGRFSGDSGDFRGRGGEGAFSTIWRGSSGVFEAHPGTPVPSAPYSPSFITTEGKRPRDSRGHDKGDNYQEKALNSISSSQRKPQKPVLWFIYLISPCYVFNICFFTPSYRQ